jgi:hypothetical protein
MIDDFFTKMGINSNERRELMHQMKQYRLRQPPFDIEIGATEIPYTWWFSLEDSFPNGEDYLVQLALKLYSVNLMQLDVNGFGQALVGYMAKGELA